MKHKRHVSEVIDFLEKSGATIRSVERTKHIKIKFDYAGKAMTTIVSASPSDWRAGLNKRSEIRAMLRTRDLEVGK